MKNVPPIGARVVRNRTYADARRVLTGTVMRHYFVSGQDQPTHAIIDYDDGKHGTVHPTALDLISMPLRVPRFDSLEQADAWLDANVR